MVKTIKFDLEAVNPLLNTAIPDYSVSPSSTLNHIIAFLIGFAMGFAILFIFYKIPSISMLGGFVFGAVNIFNASQKALSNRKTKLRVQFFDMLEALSVAMRAGNPLLKALESAREDLLLIYPEDSDIIKEIDIITGRFENAIPLSVIFNDLANRSGLDDIASFASVYATIEGKSSKADEIVRQTQQIIADKMEIELEIGTMMASAKNEANIMQVMPLVILAVIGTVGAGFMDSLYTTFVGRVVSSAGLLIFIISYFMARKIVDIKL